MTLSYKFSGDVYDYGRGGHDDCGCEEQRVYGSQGGRRGQDDCNECGRERGCDEYLVLAIATVPMQKWRLTYSPEKALCAGTMFAELNLPFKGGKCR